MSGQSGCDPATGSLADGLDAQTERMLANLDAILAAAQCSKKDIVVVTLMFSDIGHFKRVDEIYAKWMPPRETIPLPACNAFESKNLPGAPWFRSMPLPRSPKPRARLTHVSSISLLDTDKRIFPEARASPPPPRAKDRRPQLNPLFAQNLAHIFFIISAEAATVRPRERDRPRGVSKTMRIGQ